MLLADVIAKLAAIQATCDNATQACIALQAALSDEVSAIDPVATMQQINSLQQQVTELQTAAAVAIKA